MVGYFLQLLGLGCLECHVVFSPGDREMTSNRQEQYLLSVSQQSVNRRCWGVVVGTTVLGVFLSASAHAAVFTVNATVDAVDVNPGDGVCETAPGNGVCTLRAAVQEANALFGADIINLPSGNFLLSLAGQGENAAVSGDLDITDNLTIVGAGHPSTTINGGQLDRVFDVDPFSTGITLDLRDVSITGGVVDFGGALRVNANGRLVLSNSALNFNAAVDGGGIHVSNGASASL